MESPSNLVKINNNRSNSVNTLKVDDDPIQNFVENTIFISENVQNKKLNLEETNLLNYEKGHFRQNSKKKMKRCKSTGVLYQKVTDYDSDQSDSCDSSLESLIKHSLSTTKVMHPIPVTKAKERNYLHGRSGAESLLGRAELKRIFPKSEVTIFISTWNMNNKEPPENLNDLFLADKMENLPDIYVIGTQESFSGTSEWEINIQETLGPTHVLFHSETLGTLYLGIFIRRELIWYCSLPEHDSYSVRPGSSFKTKGAVGICFYLFGSSFLFITSHLTAHDDKLQERISDVERIMKSLDLPKRLPINRRIIQSRVPNVVHNFDYVFWCGDLNFRLTQPREQILDWLANNTFSQDCSTPFPFYDQLTSSMKRGIVFRGFQEAPITFSPTYKFDPGTQVYDTSHKKRVPSYTDRILFRCRRSNRSILTPIISYTSIKYIMYTSVHSFCTSDHKPVWGLYTCKIRPGIDTIPLAVGLFDRDVYLEALRRRALNQKNAFPFASSKCSLQ